jgi:hypothetical protein
MDSCCDGIETQDKKDIFAEYVEKSTELKTLENLFNSQCDVVTQCRLAPDIARLRCELKRMDLLVIGSAAATRADAAASFAVNYPTAGVDTGTSSSQSNSRSSGSSSSLSVEDVGQRRPNVTFGAEQIKEYPVENDMKHFHRRRRN